MWKYVHLTPKLPLSEVCIFHGLRSTFRTDRTNYRLILSLYTSTLVPLCLVQKEGKETVGLVVEIRTSFLILGSFVFSSLSSYWPKKVSTPPDRFSVFSRLKVETVVDSSSRRITVGNSGGSGPTGNLSHQQCEGFDSPLPLFGRLKRPGTHVLMDR